MGENSLIIAGVVFVWLIILGLIQKYIKKPNKEDDVYYVYCGETYYDAEVNANIGFDRPSHLEDIIELCTN